MKYLLSYPLALVWGLYFYLVFEIVFYVRFADWNTEFDAGTLALYLVGLGSILLCQWLSRRKPGHELAMTVAFFAAIPFAFFLALLGGLFGALGVVVGGLVPFAVILPITHLLLPAPARA